VSVEPVWQALFDERYEAQVLRLDEDEVAYAGLSGEWGRLGVVDQATGDVILDAPVSLDDLIVRSKDVRSWVAHVEAAIEAYEARRR
jgi:hypothetical protein